MGIHLHGSGMITIFPKCAFATFSLIILLACPARNQLHGLGYDFLPFIILYYDVDMVRGHCVIQDGGPKTLLCLEEPL